LVNIPEIAETEKVVGTVWLAGLGEDSTGEAAKTRVYDSRQRRANSEDRVRVGAEGQLRFTRAVCVRSSLLGGSVVEDAGCLGDLVHSCHERGLESSRIVLGEEVLLPRGENCLEVLLPSLVAAGLKPPRCWIGSREIGVGRGIKYSSMSWPS